MQAVEQFFQAHPWAQAAFLFVVFGIITALTNYLARWSSEEAWEQAKKDSPALTSVVALLRAIGVDPVKAVRAVATLLACLVNFIKSRFGGGGPPSPPTPSPVEAAPTRPDRGSLRAVALAAALFVGSLSCSAGLTRAQARGALLTVADAVVLVDKQCARLVETLPNKSTAVAIGTRCVKAYVLARASLITAADALDTYEAVTDKRFVCAAQSAVRAASSFAGVLSAAGATLSPAVVDGLALGQGLLSLASGACEEVSSAGK